MGAEKRVSRGEVMHVLVDLVEATASGVTLDRGRARAVDAAEVVDDLALLQRVAAALATVVVFELATPRAGTSTQPSTGDQLHARLAYVRQWARTERLRAIEAMWQVDQ